MIEVMHVDQGEQLFKFCLTMPFEEVIEIITDRLLIPRSLVLLYDSEGFIIDSSTLPTLPDNSQLFLFRRDSVNKSSAISEQPWENFKNFPLIDSYELPFSFEDQCKSPSNYEKVKKIEKNLYELYCTSKKLYATFMVKQEYIEKGKSMIDIRIKASYILLKSTAHYYKEIKTYWKEVFKQSFELLSEYDCAERHFSESYDALPLKFQDENMCKLIKEAKLKNFASNALRKAKNCWSKLNKVKSLLTRINIDLKNSTALTNNVKSFFENCSRMSSNFDIKNKHKHFLALLKVCELYSECRENIAKIMARNTKSKRDPLMKLISMEEQIVFYKDLNIQSAKVFSEIEIIETSMKECLYKVEDHYRIKIVGVTSTVSQKLKYKVKAGLQKLEKKLNTLREFRRFLYIPLKIQEAYTSAKEVTKHYQENKDNIQNMYSGICNSLIDFHDSRRDFLTRFGEILPCDRFPELVVPMFSASQVKEILNISGDCVQSEFNPKSVDSDKIREHYEREVKNLEKHIDNESNNLEMKTTALYREIRDITSEIVELESQKNDREINLRNITQELNLIKGKGHEEYALNLSQEVRKLKEKEAMFKEIFMEQLKDLHESNSRLKNSFYETPQ